MSNRDDTRLEGGLSERERHVRGAQIMQASVGLHDGLDVWLPTRSKVWEPAMPPAGVEPAHVV